MSDVAMFAVACSLLVSVGALVLALRLSARAVRLRAENRRLSDLLDGIVLRASGDELLDASPEARAGLGAAPGASLAALLSDHLGDGREEALAALDALVRDGRPLRLLARDRTGRPLQLSGHPRGGEILLSVADGSLLATELSRAEARMALRERALVDGLHEKRVMGALIEAGGAIAWQRDAEGTVVWSAGSVATAEGRVGAGQTTALLAARPRSAEIAPGAVSRTRLEILPAGAIEPLPLQVVEVGDQHGGACGLATDGTVAAQAERTLGRFVQTMTETFAHLTAGLAIFDRSQKLVLFNPAFATLLQLDPAWLANRPGLRDVVDALRARRRIPETGDFHAWRRRLLSLFDHPERVDLDEVWHLVDGSNIKVLARPHPHGSLAFVFDDITDRMRLEQRLGQSNDLYGATLNRLEEGLAVFGADGKLQLVNDSFHRVFGTDSRSVPPETHASDVVRLCRGLTIETEVWRRVSNFITAEGARGAWSERLTLASERVLRLRLAPLPGGATMLVVVDITDSERIADALRERNRALEAAEEMRSAVMDQISHRLRTPLNTIFGFGQLLSDPRFGQLSERQREYAGGILEASGQLLSTIDEVTELASLHPGDWSDQGGGLAIGETVELTRSLLEKRAAEAGLRLRTAVAEPGARVDCDAGSLRQIAFILGAGAIQRAAPGSTVRIEAGPGEGGRIEISVFERRRTPQGEETAEGVGLRALVRPDIATLRGRSDFATSMAGGADTLALTQQMVEAAGGSFFYGPAAEPARAGARAGGSEMRTIAVFDRARTPEASEPQAAFARR
ncbi:MAG: PAS-domain containing protein [Paracoccaceae bacterium]